LGHDSSGSESIEENISESGSSGNYEPPLDFTQSEDFLARQIQAALFRDDTKHSRITETASISSSETTESTESDDYGAEDYTTHMANENYDTLLMNRAQTLGADATAAGTKMFNGNGKRLAKDSEGHDCASCGNCSSHAASDDEDYCEHDHSGPSHHTCRCVHCELLGNTKNNPDSRAATAQDRLRKKLKQRQQEQQLKKRGNAQPQS